MESYLITSLYNLDCIKFGKFELKNKKISPFYVDIRNILSEPNIIKIICEQIYEKFIKTHHLEAFKNNETLSICGLPYSGIPIASYISCIYNIPLLLLRKEQKSYGTKKMLEGVTDKTNKILLLDDVITSGSSISESLQFFDQLKIIDIVTIIDRESKKSIENYKSLYKISDIFKILKSNNLIDDEKFTNSLNFIKNC